MYLVPNGSIELLWLDKFFKHSGIHIELARYFLTHFRYKGKLSKLANIQFSGMDGESSPQ